MTTEQALNSYRMLILRAKEEVKFIRGRRSASGPFPTELHPDHLHRLSISRVSWPRITINGNENHQIV